MGIKVAYGKRVDITGAIESGVIPKDSLVITSDAKEAELYFYDTDGQIKYVSERKRFETMDEAREWIKTYDCTGHIISIYDGGDWAPYIVTSGGELAAIVPTVTTDDNGKVLQVVDGAWVVGDAPTGNVQADWSQNDETKPDYVKNRPFYTGSPVETVLLAETTLNVQAQQNGILIFGVQNVDFAFETGQTYKVSWDGTTYSCVAFVFEGSVFIGNQQIIGGADTGEPFIAAVDSNTFMIYTSDTATSHTISIIGMVVPITKIDKKYLPEFSAIYTGDPVNWSDGKKQQMYTDFTAGKLVLYSPEIDIYRVVLSAYYSDYIDLRFLCLDSSGDLYIHSCSSHDNDSRTALSQQSLEHTIQNVINATRAFCLYVAGSDTQVGDLMTAYLRFDETTKKACISTQSKGSNWNVDLGRFTIVTNGDTDITLTSSTPDSTKQFKITVDDNGVISATEVEA